MTDSFLAKYDPDDEGDELDYPNVYPDSHGFDQDLLDNIQELEGTIRWCRGRMPLRVYKAINALVTTPNKIGAIATEFKTTPETIYKYLNSDDGRTLFATQSRLIAIKSGPLKEQRMHIAWRIARASETKAPRIALQALDYLSKVQGDYVQTISDDTGVTVVVQQFNLTSKQNDSIPTAIRVESPKAKKQTDIIEGDFTPVEINPNG